MRNRNRRGFTLVEIMVVVVIISLLASMGIFIYMQQASEARIEMTKTMIAQTSEQLDLFKLKKGKYPTAISELVSAGYAKETPKDAWRNELLYQRDPQSVSGFKLGSYGADGTPGGDGENMDIWNTDPK